MTGGRESGSVTLWLMVMAVAMFAAVGLVSDGGQAMAVKGTAISDAYGAARAGANQLTLRSGQVGPGLVDVVAAQRAAATFLAQAGVKPGESQIVVTPQEVTVTVHLTSPTDLLGAVGISAFHVTGYGSARPYRGVARPSG